MCCVRRQAASCTQSAFVTPYSHPGFSSRKTSPKISVALSRGRASGVLRLLWVGFLSFLSFL